MGGKRSQHSRNAPNNMREALKLKNVPFYHEGKNYGEYEDGKKHGKHRAHG